MEFKKVTEKDIPIIKNILNSFNEYSCEFSIINLLVWQDYYGFGFCIEDGVLYSKNFINGKTSFGIPFSKDMPKAIAKLKQYCYQNNLKFVFFGGKGERFDILCSQMPNVFNFAPVRDSFEYIYNSSDLRELAGKKYHSKRNHISGFNKKYNWSYEKLSKDNSEEVIKMLYHWYDCYTEKNASSMETEKTGITNILRNYDIDGIKGGVLRVDGNIIAFTLGCQISPTVFDVNFEKALVEFDGAYAMINNQFVINELSDYIYINREEDMGIEGLRKAKLSYKPAILLEKFIMEEINC